MQKTRHNEYFPKMRRVVQATNAHCGPAVLTMLLSHLGVEISQNQVVEAAGVEDKIEEYGITIQDMAKAIGRISPEFAFWFRDHATSRELDFVVNKKHYPVGVEWQGLFYEFEDDDNGHYAIVTHIDINGNRIFLADPFEAFARKDRKFYLDKFLHRWWDVNETKGPEGTVRHEVDDQMMFIVTERAETFPLDLGMKRG